MKMKIKKFKNIITEIQSLPLNQRAVAFDFESENLYKNSDYDARDPRVAKPTMVSFAVRKKNRRSVFSMGLPWGPECKALLRYLYDQEIVLISYNSFYDICLAVWNGALPELLFESKCVFFDLFITRRLLTIRDRKISVGLKAQVDSVLGHKMVTYADSEGQSKKQYLEFLEFIIKKSKNKTLKKTLKANPELKENISFIRRKIFESLKKTNRNLNQKISTALSKLKKDLRIQRSYEKKLDQGILIEKSKELLDKKKIAVDKKRGVYNSLVDQKTKFGIIVKNVIASIKGMKGALAQSKQDFQKYCVDDSIYTLKLYYKSMRQLKENNMLNWHSVERTVGEAAVQCTLWGIRIDPRLLAEEEERFKAEHANLHQELIKIAGRDFNVNSSEQLSHVMFNRPEDTPPGLGIPAPNNVSKLASGYYSTSASILERINHPFVEKILQYKALSKLLSSYLPAFLKALKLNPVSDSRINCVTNPAGAVTGRATSKGYELSKVQIQNIPRSLRNIFTAAPGNRLIVSDLSQIEYRLAGVVSEEEHILRVYRDDYLDLKGFRFYLGDLHQATADSVGTSRKRAKTINFGILYGMGVVTLSRKLRLVVPKKQYPEFNKKVLAHIQELFPRLSKDNCIVLGWDNNLFKQEFRSLYGRYPFESEILFSSFCSLEDKEVIDYFQGNELLRKYEEVNPSLFATMRNISNLIKYGKDHSYRLPTGKKIWLPTDMAPSKVFNYVIQGYGADVLKLAIFTWRKYVYSKMPEMKFVAQVHDELVFEVPEHKAEEAGILVKYIMENLHHFIPCPILVSCKICQTWGAKEDDAIAEVGYFYYKNKEKKEFIVDKYSWPRYYKDLSEDNVEVHSSTAVLSDEQKQWAKDFIGPVNDFFGV